MAEDTASAKGDGRDALRTGIAEDTTSANRDGRDALRTGITEDTTSANRDGRDALRTGFSEDPDLYSPRNCQAIMGICVGGLGLLPP